MNEEKRKLIERYRSENALFDEFLAVFYGTKRS